MKKYECSDFLSMLFMHTNTKYKIPIQNTQYTTQMINYECSDLLSIFFMHENTKYRYRKNYITQIQKKIQNTTFIWKTINALIFSQAFPPQCFSCLKIQQQQKYKIHNTNEKL